MSEAENRSFDDASVVSRKKSKSKKKQQKLQDLAALASTGGIVASTMTPSGKQTSQTIFLFAGVCFTIAGFSIAYLLYRRMNRIETTLKRLLEDKKTAMVEEVQEPPQQEEEEEEEVEEIPIPLPPPPPPAPKKSAARKKTNVPLSLDDAIKNISE